MRLQKLDLTLAGRLQQLASAMKRCRITNRSDAFMDLELGMREMTGLLAKAGSDRASVFVIGNGGSAAVASHVANDLVNVGKLRAMTIHDAPMLTCMANDYGYENAYARIIEQLARPGDILVAISSSGRSMNIRNAVTQMQATGGTVITLTGFLPDNPLRTMGDFNVWLDSSDYGIVEVGHQFVLHNLCDRFNVAFAREAA